MATKKEDTGKSTAELSAEQIRTRLEERIKRDEEMARLCLRDGRPTEAEVYLAYLVDIRGKLDALNALGMG